MTFLKKLSIAVASSVTSLLILGNWDISVVQAAVYKFNFQNEEVSGYFVYNDTTEGVQFADSTAYYDAGYEYRFDLGQYGVYEGSAGSPIVFSPRAESGYPGLEDDNFLWQVSAIQRGNGYAFVSYFRYPKDSFSGSQAVRTSVPSSSLIEVYPTVDFPNSLGDVAYSGVVSTWIEEVPEPTSIGASLIVALGSGFVSYRQRQKSLSLKD